MSGKPVLFKLVLFYAREAWSGRTLAFFGLMLCLSAFLLWGMPSLAPDASKMFPPVSFSIVDLDDSFISRTLIEQISQMTLVETVYVEPLETARQRLSANETLLILIFPEDFYEISMRNEQRPPIKVYLNDRKPVETALFVRFLDNMANSIEGVQASFFSFAETMRPLFDDNEAYVKTLDGAFAHIAFQMLGRRAVVAVDDSGKLNTVHHVISALICLLAMQTSLLLLTQVQQDRRSGVHERLILAGVGWWQPLLARQLTGLAWLAAGFAPLLAGLFHAYPDAARLPLILSVFILYWITGLLCQSLGYLGRPGDTILLGAWLGILALLLIGGCIYPDPLLPPFIQKSSNWTPAYWAYQTTYRALAGQAPVAGTWLAGGLITAAATLLAAISWHRSGASLSSGGQT
jgi:hypothetical protein